MSKPTFKVEIVKSGGNYCFCQGCGKAICKGTHCKKCFKEREK